MGDTAPRRGGGGWQPRGRGRGYFRGNGGRFNGNQGPRAGPSTSSLPLLESQSSQQVITDMLEVSQGPYSGWRLYHKQETEQRKRRSPNWGEAETQQLLKLWAERVTEMKTTKRNGFMLEEMAQMLQASGFSRSSTEVKTRIANLSQEYRMEMRKRSLGFPHGNFKLWESVHAILGSEEAALSQNPDQASQQPPHFTSESWQQEQAEQDNQQGSSGEDAEALCCDIDPGMLMGQQDTGDEEEAEDNRYHQEEEVHPPPSTIPPDHQPLPSPLNGLPPVPSSLTISLTPAPPSQATSNGSAVPPPAHSRMPALIRVAPKRTSQDSSNSPPVPPLVRKPVGKRPRHSMDSVLLPQHIKMEGPFGDMDYNTFRNCVEESFESGGWAVVAEQLRQAHQAAESRAMNLTNLMEQQIKLQKQGLKMQKRLLTILENLQPHSSGEQHNTEPSNMEGAQPSEGATAS